MCAGITTTLERQNVRAGSWSVSWRSLAVSPMKTRVVVSGRLARSTETEPFSL
jgi:hypothetical protein